MIEGYAQFIIEFTREQLGYDRDDSTHDEEVLQKLQRGEKLSKSKHLQVQDTIGEENEI